MNNREKTLAILNYQSYEGLPVVHFGFWRKKDGVLYKWAREGHISREEADNWSDGNEWDRRLSEKLGFDFDYNNLFSPSVGLDPPLEERLIEVLPDGGRKVMQSDGVVVLEKDGAGSIPMTFDHTLKGRKEWEEIFLPRLQFSEERVSRATVRTPSGDMTFDDGGREYLLAGDWRDPLGLKCGSLYGTIRTWLGMEEACYLQVDDEPLFDEIIDTVGNLCYQTVEAVLKTGVKFDFGHFWEDICFRSGPLINPKAFEKKVGPHYKRITDLLREHGITIVSLDCDGKIDTLVPIWLENGVNTMFPIEVGTWNASIAPWRKEYGKELRGVGGMDKKQFAYDFAAVDREIERLKPLIELGGYLPCPDHRIAPDAEWDNVRYYCDRMRKAFG